MTTPSAPHPSDRARVRRLPQRGHYARNVVDSILDEGMIALISYQIDGQPYLIPTAYARVDDQLVLHGSVASRSMRHLASGAEVCICVTLIDGMVIARSMFHHSMNYRSVIAFGRATPIIEEEEKKRLLIEFTDRIVPGRGGEARPPTTAELRQTSVCTFPLDDAAAKIRSGPAVDDDADLALPIWAGVVPLRMQWGPVRPDSQLVPNAPLPSALHVWGVAQSKRDQER